MKPGKIFFLLIILAGFFGLLASCQKNDVLNSDPQLKLNFSNDSVIFDTVFTSLGSATRRLMVSTFTEIFK